MPTRHVLAALRWALFEIFFVTIIIDGAALREVCLRVRPQGERAVVIHWFDCAWKDDSMVVDLLLFGWNPDF